MKTSYIVCRRYNLYVAALLSATLASCTSIVLSLENGRTHYESSSTPPTDVPTVVDVPDARPPPPMPSYQRLGQPCTDSSTCGGLNCDLSVVGGECTIPCDLLSEDGGEETCRRVGGVCISGIRRNVESGHCALLCGRGFSSCPRNFHCFASSAGLDPSGCENFCQSDDECLRGQRCNVRTGQCGAAAFDPSKLDDGRLCRVPTLGEVSPCKGVCAGISASDRTQGICVSLTLQISANCPDFAAPPDLSAGDVGVCYQRPCSAERCCPDGMLCREQVLNLDTGYCWPTSPAPRPDLQCSINSDAGDAGPIDGSTERDATATQDAQEVSTDSAAGVQDASEDGAMMDADF